MQVVACPTGTIQYLMDFVLVKEGAKESSISWLMLAKRIEEPVIPPGEVSVWVSSHLVSDRPRLNQLGRANRRSLLRFTQHGRDETTRL